VNVTQAQRQSVARMFIPARRRRHDEGITGYIEEMNARDARNATQLVGDKIYGYSSAKYDDGEAATSDEARRRGCQYGRASGQSFTL